MLLVPSSPQRQEELLPVGLRAPLPPRWAAQLLRGPQPCAAVPGTSPAVSPARPRRCPHSRCKGVCPGYTSWGARPGHCAAALRDGEINASSLKTYSLFIFYFK